MSTAVTHTLVPGDLPERAGSCLASDLSGVTFVELPELGHSPDGALRLARAVDASTVLVATALRLLPARDRALVLAHELAHTVQLSRGGDDGEETLEAEAWAAAAAVLSGEQFEIRGAASRPLDARAFVASNMAAAGPYYRRFPHEPTGDRQAVAISSVTDFPATAAGLFSVLRSQCRRGDALVIVAHSSEHGVALRLVANSQLGLNVENVNRIMRVVGRQADARAAAVTELARDARLSDAAATALVDDIIAVRALGLSAVHFRGCNLSAWEDTPRTFRELFACPLVTGLNLRSSFASITPTVLQANARGAAQVFARTTSARSSVRSVVDGPVGQRFAYQYQLDLAHHTLSFRGVFAESAAAPGAWIRRHLPAPQPAYTSGPIPVHALLSLGDLIFPYANGSPASEYTSHIGASTPGSDWP